MLPSLTVLPLFFLSSLHCLRAIGKHCLSLFFFTIDFCMFFVSLMFCLMPLLRSLFHWKGFCLLSIVPSSSLLSPCSVVYLRFIKKFLVFFELLFMFLVIGPSNINPLFVLFFFFRTGQIQIYEILKM